MLERNRIYNMDCVAGMKLLDDGSIDLTVTSPPYDNLRMYKGYSFDFDAVATELFRVTKDGGDKITGTERKADGTVKYMSAVKKHTGRKVKPFGVRTNVWHYGMGFMKSTTDRIAYKPPAIFPEKLAHDHIISWSNPGDVVLDPFMGSGTVAKMGRLAGRDYIGFEISPEYCAIAEERLKCT